MTTSYFPSLRPPDPYREERIRGLSKLIKYRVYSPRTEESSTEEVQSKGFEDFKSGPSFGCMQNFGLVSTSFCKRINMQLHSEKKQSDTAISGTCELLAAESRQANALEIAISGRGSTGSNVSMFSPSNSWIQMHYHAFKHMVCIKSIPRFSKLKTLSKFMICPDPVSMKLPNPYCN
jgi:hypothetical protein